MHNRFISLNCLECCIWKIYFRVQQNDHESITVEATNRSEWSQPRDYYDEDYDLGKPWT